MINLLLGMRLLVQREDRIRNVIHRYDIDPRVWVKRQNGEIPQKDERAHHVELRGFRAAAVSQDDTGAKYRSRHIREQFLNHVLAEFLCARVGIVVGAAPINGAVFVNEFVAAVSRHSDGADLAEPAQPMRIVRLWRST